MRRAPFRLPLVFVASLLLGVSGLACTEGLGGRCVQDSDCSSGSCSSPGESTEGGRCVSSGTTFVPTPDAYSSSDASIDAPSGDAAPVSDAAPASDAAAHQDATPASDAAAHHDGASPDSRTSTDSGGHDSSPADAHGDLGADC